MDSTGKHMDWIDINENGTPPPKDYGRYFAVKVNSKLHIALWRHPQWDSGWNIPVEWSRPTHYYPLPDDAKFCAATMD